MVYAIFEGNMERLEKKLNRIANKCKAYDCDFHYEQVGETEFGYTYIYKMIGEDGNVYTWKTSKVIDEDEEVLIIGTIKNHNEYRGIKQTELTRCRVAA